MDRLIASQRRFHAALERHPHNGRLVCGRCLRTPSGIRVGGRQSAGRQLATRQQLATHNRRRGPVDRSEHCAAAIAAERLRRIAPLERPGRGSGLAGAPGATGPSSNIRPALSNVELADRFPREYGFARLFAGTCRIGRHR